MRWTMHLHLSTLFVAIFIVVAVVTGAQRIRSTAIMLDTAATDLLRVVIREANDHLERVIEAATLAATMLSRTPLATRQSEAERLPDLPLMQEALKATSSIESVYAGYGTGDMFMLRRPPDGSARPG